MKKRIIKKKVNVLFSLSDHKYVWLILIFTLQIIIKFLVDLYTNNSDGNLFKDFFEGEG